MLASAGIAGGEGAGDAVDGLGCDDADGPTAAVGAGEDDGADCGADGTGAGVVAGGLKGDAVVAGGGPVRLVDSDGASVEAGAAGSIVADGGAGGADAGDAVAVASAGALDVGGAAGECGTGDRIPPTNQAARPPTSKIPKASPANKGVVFTTSFLPPSSGLESKAA